MVRANFKKLEFKCIKARNFSIKDPQQGFYNITLEVRKNKFVSVVKLRRISI